MQEVEKWREMVESAQQEVDRLKVVYMNKSLNHDSLSCEQL